MNLPPDIQELLEKHLQGELKGEEKMRFEALIESDPMLKAEVEKQLRLQRMLEAGVEQIGSQQLRARLLEIHRKVSEEEAASPEENETWESPGRAPGRKRWLWILLPAAAVIIFLVIWKTASFLPHTQKPLDCRELLTASTYQPMDLLLRGSRGASESQESLDLYIQADEAFQQGLFSKAEGLYHKAASIDSQLNQNSKFLLLWGASAMESGKMTQARSLFQQVSQNPQENIFQNKADWYLYISYLKGCDTQQAQRILERIATDNSHEYHQQAKDLLKKFKPK